MKWRNMLGVNGGKLLTLICAAVVAGCAFADRTANREWVGRNFAPSNLVPRVEALENKTDSETLALGEDSFAECTDAVAIGAGASASGLGTVQLGRGENTNPETLRFHSWTVIDSDGKVPQERLPTETDPVFGAWRDGQAVTAGNGSEAGFDGVAFGDYAKGGNQCSAIGPNVRANGNGAVAIGSGAVTASDYAVALGAGSTALGANSVQLGMGTNEDPGTLKFMEWTLVGADGKMPAARLPSKWATGNLTNANGVAVVELKEAPVGRKPDGMDWQMACEGSQGWRGLAYGNGRFVGVAGDRKGVWYSDDGLEWLQGSETTSGWRALTFGNGRFVAGAYNIYGLWYSDDGINWTLSKKENATWESLTFGNGHFVAGGDMNLWYSDDGDNWTKCDDTYSHWYTLAWGKGRYIAGNGGNKGIYYSDDGVHWSRSNIQSGYWQAACYGNGRFLICSTAGGGAGGIWYSDDGANWYQSTKTDEKAVGVYCLNGRYFAGFQMTGIWYSDDGVNWARTHKTDGYFYGMAYGKGRYVALDGASASSVWYSDDIATDIVPVVQRIRVNGVELTADEDNVVDIPIATLKAALGIE